MKRKSMLGPIIFGLGDGMTSLLGVVLYLTHHPQLVLPAAISGGISSAVSMAGFSWLSESDEGIVSSCMLGAATGIGAVCPAIPFAFLRGGAALACSLVICGVVGLGIAVMHSGQNKWMSMLQTFGVLIVTFSVVFACNFFLPGGPG